MLVPYLNGWKTSKVHGAKQSRSTATRYFVDRFPLFEEDSCSPDPWTYAGLKASYLVMLFTTPYIGHSFLLSALYIITLRPRLAGKPQVLPP